MEKKSLMIQKTKSKLDIFFENVRFVEVLKSLVAQHGIFSFHLLHTFASCLAVAVIRHLFWCLLRHCHCLTYLEGRSACLSQACEVLVVPCLWIVSMCYRDLQCGPRLTRRTQREHAPSPPPYVLMLGDGDVDVYVSVDVRMCGCVGVWMCRWWNVEGAFPTQHEPNVNMPPPPPPYVLMLEDGDVYVDIHVLRMKDRKNGNDARNSRA